jgi:outer membrane protein assembly factor BamB
MARNAFLGAALFACTMVSVACGNDAAVLPGESRTTAARLAEVRKKIDDKKYTEAIDELQAILDTAGNDLVPLTPQHCVQARRLCHGELSRLPAEALREYRLRVDPKAKKWLEEATPTRDVRLLRRIVDEAFCSHSGETAVDLLGDLAFERGHFDEAVAWWRRLAPPLGAKQEKHDGAAFVYPDAQGDRAKLHAKQIIAHYFAGATDEAKREWKAFQAEFTMAEGTLAGRKGKYINLLQDLLKEAPPAAERTWTTFGGDATRGLVLPLTPTSLPKGGEKGGGERQRWLERLAQTVKDGPMWRFNLETRTPYKDAPPPGFGFAESVRARTLAFHPLICGHYVIVNDARYVTAYDLDTGKATVWYDVKDLNALADPNLKLPAPTDLRYTLTADNDCLYVRLGAQGIFNPDDADRNDPDPAHKEAEKNKRIASFIACLSLDAAAKDNRLRWCMRPQVLPGKPVLAQAHAIFEGTPTIHNGFLYVAVTWFEGDRTLTAIQCYPAGTDNTPPLRWEQTVCETRELKPKEVRSRHHLLTVAGPNVVYCSHSGAIIAVDVQTGKTVWAARYPSKTPTNADEPSLRDLTPCVYAAGRLYAAPADYDRLLCLDPLTGETLWERERIAPTHLLGVGQGRLIFTTLTELRAVNATDGSDIWRLPGGGGQLATTGRGFLIGDVVVWPAANGVKVRWQENGDPEYITALERVPVGNLLYSNGVLVVADRTTLSVFVPQEFTPHEAKQQTKTSEPVPTPVADKPFVPERRAIDASTMAFPLQRTLSLAMDGGEHVLCVQDDQLLTGREEGALRRLSTKTAEKQWTCKVSFAPSWAERAGELIFAGGKEGVTAVRANDGGPVWQIRSFSSSPDGLEPLSGFHYTAGRLFFLQNEERLYAVDAATGTLLWSQWAIGAKLKLSPPLGRFHSHFLANSTTLLVQPTPGLTWLLDAATGKRLHEEHHRFEPWPRPPVALDDETVAVVLDARTVALIDRTTGKRLWEHVNQEATTATGAPPQLIAAEKNLLLLTPNNIGYTLQRLDRATGKPLWERPPLLETKTALDAAGWSLDQNVVYCVEDQVLTARALADGKILWRQALAGADGGWQTRRIGDTVLAYPLSAGTRQMQFRWLCFSVQWQMNGSREIGLSRGLPVICCDAKSGRLTQRLNLVAGPPRVRTRLGFLSRFAAQPRFDYVLKEAAPRVVVSRTDLVIAFDAHVWRYCSAR